MTRAPLAPGSQRGSWLAVLGFCLGVGCHSTPGFFDNREPDDSVPVAEGDGVYHLVKKGETARMIAAAYHVRLDDLLGINDIRDPRSIKASDHLFVPGARSALTAPIIVPKTPSFESGSSDAGEAAARDKLLWPVDGIVTSRFGIRGSRKHDGLDIAAPEGTRILAAKSGTVLYVGDGYRGYGNLIIVRHEAGLVTVYAHNRKNLVREGQSVERGQHIADVGQTGRAEAPHLHFEVRQLDRPKNPLLFLP